MVVTFVQCLKYLMASGNANRVGLSLLFTLTIERFLHTQGEPCILISYTKTVAHYDISQVRGMKLVLTSLLQVCA